MTFYKNYNENVVKSFQFFYFLNDNEKNQLIALVNFYKKEYNDFL